MQELKNVKFRVSRDIEGVLESKSYGAPLAARWRRFCAVCIDVAIGMVIFIVYFRVTGRFEIRSQYSWGGMADRVFGAFVGFGIWLVLNYYFLNLYSQTIGKRLFGIRIVQLNGQPATPARVAMLRYLPITFVGIVPIIGPLIGTLDALFIVRPDRRCLHDLLAGTVVVDYVGSA